MFHQSVGEEFDECQLSPIQVLIHPKYSPTCLPYMSILVPVSKMSQLPVATFFQQIKKNQQVGQILKATTNTVLVSLVLFGSPK